MGGWSGWSRRPVWMAETQGQYAPVLPPFNPQNEKPHLQYPQGADCPGAARLSTKTPILWRHSRWLERSQSPPIPLIHLQYALEA
jgi:hypothetical protein